MIRDTEVGKIEEGKHSLSLLQGRAVSRCFSGEYVPADYFS